MAYAINAGALRTRIQVFDGDGEERYNENGRPVRDRRNVFGEGKFIHCRWINLFGTEVLAAKQLGVEEGATLTLRYSPKITPACEIYKESDPAPYEVISINDIEDRHTWLEVKVQRKVVAQ